MRPYDGTPALYERFISDLEVRLSREHLHGARSVDEFSLANTMDGSDDYGEVVQAGPERIIGPVNKPGISATKRRERANKMEDNKMEDHKKRNSMVYSFLVLFILYDNLKIMLHEAIRDGYAALWILRAQCYREPNNLTLAEIDRVWLAFTFKDMGIDADTFVKAPRFLHSLNKKRSATRKKDQQGHRHQGADWLHARLQPVAVYARNVRL